MKWTGWHEVVLTSEANETACAHLLQHFRCGKRQEDLCFGLWTPGTGAEREMAIVMIVLLPVRGKRNLHDNANFKLGYLTRAPRAAIRSGHGLAFMHSHPPSASPDGRCKVRW